MVVAVVKATQDRAVFLLGPVVGRKLGRLVVDQVRQPEVSNCAYAESLEIREPPDPLSQKCFAEYLRHGDEQGDEYVCDGLCGDGVMITTGSVH